MWPGFSPTKSTRWSTFLKQRSLSNNSTLNFKKHGQRKFKGLVPNYFRILCFIQQINQNLPWRFTSHSANLVFYFSSWEGQISLPYLMVRFYECLNFSIEEFSFCYILIPIFCVFHYLLFYFTSRKYIFRSAMTLKAI